MSFLELLITVGIVLACLLGLLLAIVLAVFLLPVKTKLKATGENESTDVLFHAVWLFGLFSFKIQYFDKRVSYHGRILIFRFLDGEVGADEINKVQEVLEEEGIINETKSADSDFSPDNNSENANDNKQVFEQILFDSETPQIVPMGRLTGKLGLYRRKWKERRKNNSLKRVEYLVKTIIQKYRTYRTKKKEIKEILSTESGIKAKKALKILVLKLLNHLKPKNSKGSFTFGFEQPDYTALVYGFTAALLEHVGNGKMVVIPDFYYKGIKSDFVIMGRFIIAYLLYCGLKLILNKDIDRVQKAIRRVF